MNKEQNLSKILSGKLPTSKYSTTNFKVIDKSTTEIVGEIKRFDERKTGFNKAARGEYGDTVKGPAEKANSSIDKSIMGYFFESGKMPGMPKMGNGGMKPGMPPKGDNTGKEGMNPNMGAKPAGMAKLPMAMMMGGPKGAPKHFNSDIEVVSRHIKSYGTFMGADLVGICEIPDYAYYSHDKNGNPVEKKYKYAICLVVDQDYDTLDASNGKDWISGAQSYMSYSKAAFTASAMSKYIQMQGFEAKDNHLLDYQVIVPPLLELAGIGEMGRYGIVINPSLGSRFKASLVLTNMPMAIDKPIKFGVQEFCKTCKKCAIECPSQAISSSDDKIIHNGYKKYDFKYDSCSKFRLSNPNGSSCGNCIKVCPFNKPGGALHDLARWTIRTLPIFNHLVVKGDDLLGYGTQNADNKWWFDEKKKSGNVKDKNFTKAK